MKQSYNTTNTNVNEVYRVLHKMTDIDVWSVSPSPEGPLFKEEVPEITAYYLSETWLVGVQLLKLNREGNFHN